MPDVAILQPTIHRTAAENPHKATHKVAEEAIE